MSEQTNIPFLRFPEFGEAWLGKKIGDVVTNKSEKYNSDVDQTSYRCIELEHLTSETGQLLGFTDSVSSQSIKNKFKQGDVLFGKLRPYLKKYLRAPFSGVCSSEIWVLKGLNISNDFLYRLVQTNYFIELANQSTGSKMPRADWTVISSGQVFVPNIKEQRKIATFLTATDDKLQALNRKKILLEQYKKGVMQKIFSQELRFKDDNGNNFPDWVERSLKSVTEEIRKPRDLTNAKEIEVVTISSTIGFTSQKKRFSQVIAGDSLEKYVYLKKGEFSYNRGASKKFKYGCFFALNTFDEALVPNVYISFRFINGIHPPFYSQLFSTGFADKQLRKFISSSVRLDGLLNINRNDFFSLKIPSPSLLEQTKIANFLSAIDDKINQTQSQLKQAEAWKKGLLQQMFV